MRIRKVQPGELDELQSRSPRAYDKGELASNPIVSFALEDEAGTARAIFMAELVPEVFMVMDHDWETPAMRWEMARVGAQEMRRLLSGAGHKSAYGVFDVGVPLGWVRRLARDCSGQVMKCVRFVR